MSYFEDFEEYMIGDECCSDFEYYMLSKRPKTKSYFNRDNGEKWIMKNGTKINVEDMKTDYIINSLNMILRMCSKEGWKPNKYSIYNKLRKELENRKNRGEIEIW